MSLRTLAFSLALAASSVALPAAAAAPPQPEGREPNPVIREFYLGEKPLAEETPAPMPRAKTDPELGTALLLWLFIPLSAW
jgi:hypothetical protein